MRVLLSGKKLPLSGKIFPVSGKNFTGVSGGKKLPGGGTRRFGRGCGKKGIGKGGAIRHRKLFRKTIDGLKDGSIRRLACRAGVKRITHTAHTDIRAIANCFVEKIVRIAVTLAEHRRQKTVTAMDVVYAARQTGKNLYGFGFIPKK